MLVPSSHALSPHSSNTPAEGQRTGWIGYISRLTAFAGRSTINSPLTFVDTDGRHEYNNNPATDGGTNVNTGGDQVVEQQRQQQQQDQGPPFMLPLVAGVLIAVLLCALWCGWRWYDRRAARAGGMSTGEAWEEMRRAGVTLGVGVVGSPFPGPVGPEPGAGEVGRGRERWEREREWEWEWERREGRVDPWRDGTRARARRGQADAGEDLEERGARWFWTSTTSTNVGPRPKLWEVEIENELEDLRKVRCVLPVEP